MRDQRDFSGRNLRGCSFVGQDLRGISFRGANLVDADFTSADIRSASFRDVDAQRALFNRVRTGRSFWRGLWPNLGVCLGLGLLSALALLFNIALCRAAARPGNDGILGISGVLVSVAVTLIILRKGMTPAALSAAVVVAIAIASMGGVVLQTTGAGARSFADAMAVTIASAGALTVAGGIAAALAGCGAVAGAFAGVATGAFAVGFAVGLAGTGVVATAGVVAGIFSATRTIVTAGILGLAWHLALMARIAWLVAKRDERFALAEPAGAWLRSIAGTSFKNANLTGANFEGAGLAGSNFGGAKVARVRWRGASGVHQAWFSGSFWRDRRTERLLINGHPDTRSCDAINLRGANLDDVDLAKCTLRRADLSGASLRRADLDGANLAAATCLGTDFSDARLTGACLQDWNIDHEANLSGVQCDYFFLLEDSGDRRPHQTSKILEPGVFEKLFAEVRDTIQLMIRGVGDRAACSHAFRRLLIEYPEIDVDSVRSVKREPGVIVITLAAPPGIDKEGASATFYEDYESRLVKAPTDAVLPELAYTLMPELQTGASTRRIRVFISYSHKDESLVNELKAHLSPHERTGLVEVWYDREIDPGGEWNNAIDRHLHEADVVLLAISSDFIESRYCYELEMAAAIQRHDRGEAVVIPIILRPCEWKILPRLRSLQALPKDGRPVTNWPNHDEAWTNVARGLRRTIGNWRGKQHDDSS